MLSLVLHKNIEPSAALRLEWWVRNWADPVVSEAAKISEIFSQISKSESIMICIHADLRLNLIENSSDTHANCDLAPCRCKYHDNGSNSVNQIEFWCRKIQEQPACPLQSPHFHISLIFCTPPRPCRFNATLECALPAKNSSCTPRTPVNSSWLVTWNARVRGKMMMKMGRLSASSF